MFLKAEDAAIIDTDFVEEYGLIRHSIGLGRGGWYGMECSGCANNQRLKSLACS